MSLDIQCYFKKWDTDTWINVTYYLEDLPEWTNNLNTELLQFEITLVQPLDTSNDVIIPEVGDDICITTDQGRNKVLNNALAGMIKNIRYDLKNYDPTTGFWFVRYELTIEQRNPSLELVSLDVKVATPLNDLLDQLFVSSQDAYGVSFIPTITNSADGKLNGFMYGTINGDVIPRYVNYSTNINVEAFEGTGSTFTVLVDLLKQHGYFFKVKYLVEPHATRVLNLVQQIEIFDSLGIIPTGESNFADGITNETMSTGYVNNLSFISTTDTPEEIEKYPTEKSVNIGADGDKITNYFSLDTLIMNGANLTNLKIFADGSTVYPLKNKKAKDIVYVCRYVEAKVQTVSSTTIFTIDSGNAERLVYDQSKISTDPLVCALRDTAGNRTFSAFTISGSTITLGTAVVGLDTTYTFEHVNGHDIYKEDSDMTGIEYGVIKHCKPTEVASVEFLEYDKPNVGYNGDLNNSDIISVWFYELTDRTYNQAWKSSIERYGMSYQHEELTTPITDEQYQSLLAELQKRTTPVNDISFVSLRPDLVEVGWNIKIILTNSDGSIIVNKTDLLVQSVRYRFIANNGLGDGATVEQTVTLSEFRESLQDVLKRFRKGNSTTINSAVVAVQETDTINNFGFDLW